MLQIPAPSDWFQTFGIPLDGQGPTYKVLCPIHADTNPSCSVDVEKQLFYCHACEAKGDLVDFFAASLKTTRPVILQRLGMGKKNKGAKQTREVLHPKAIEEWHVSLLRSPQYLQTLVKKGITLQTVRERRLGLNGDRVSIPVYDDNNEIVNARLWSPTDRSRKVINIKGQGGGDLFPLDAIKNADAIILTEGELKALLCIQKGFPAVSGTSGAKVWKQHWLPYFTDKIVYVVFDIDKTGRVYANRICSALTGVAKTVFDVLLPLDITKYPKGDITDYFVDEGFSTEDFVKVLEHATPWEARVIDEELNDPIPVHLSAATRAEYSGKMLVTDACVSAKDTNPYVIPEEFKVHCSKDQECCVVCPIFQSKEEPTVHVKRTSPLILEMVNAPNDKLFRTLKQVARIPSKCGVCNFQYTSSLNVEEIRLTPQLGISNSEHDHVMVTAYHLGHGIETNSPYAVTGRMIPNPKTQQATLLITEAEATNDSLSTFRLTPEIQQRLTVFTPDLWTLDAIKDKLDHIYGDLEANVTRIYERRDLHVLYDLAFHSTLYITFQGKIHKGWAEVLVVGDSGQGKSETINSLQKHYKLGEKIDCKTASAAGLIGGLQELGKRFFIVWGIITLQDGRLVVMEEVKGMATDVISKLTEVRSSGLATISKIERSRANARTRLIWISNPRSDRQIQTYNFGIEAVRELIGSLEDIRRFDAAIIVASGEVDRKWINVKESNRPNCDHVYTSDLCTSLVLWTWSRKADQVTYTEEAVDKILYYASKMGDRFSSSIPLVETSDQRLKLARLSAGLAARTFSTDNGEVLVVREGHVDYIAEFLTRIYESPACGYGRYSDMLQRDKALSDEEPLRQALLDLPYPREICQSLLDTNIVTSLGMMDLTQWDREQVQNFMGVLVRKNAIRKVAHGYIKTPGFIRLIKSMLDSSTLPSDTPLKAEDY